MGFYKDKAVKIEGIKELLFTYFQCVSLLLLYLFVYSIFWTS
jgi:hypothetical protein